jgi:hypothetical protein
MKKLLLLVLLLVSCAAQEQTRTPLLVREGRLEYKDVVYRVDSMDGEGWLGLRSLDGRVRTKALVDSKSYLDTQVGLVCWLRKHENKRAMEQIRCWLDSDQFLRWLILHPKDITY